MVQTIYSCNHYVNIVHAAIIQIFASLWSWMFDCKIVAVTVYQGISTFTVLLKCLFYNGDCSGGFGTIWELWEWSCKQESYF